MTEVGHNSNEQLRSIVERIENLEASKAEIASDIRDVYKEADGNGFDPKALRMIVRMRKQDQTELEQFEGVIDTYKAALGMD